MAASVEAIARQLQLLIEHVNALNEKTDSADRKLSEMADYPRIQKAMNEVRIQLKEALEQIGESRGGNDDGAAMESWKLGVPLSRQQEGLALG